MNRITVILIALVLLLAPIFVAVPDTPDEFLWSSWLCAAVLAAVLFAVIQAGKEPLPGSQSLADPPRNGEGKAVRMTKHSAKKQDASRLPPCLPVSGGPLRSNLLRSKEVGSFAALLGLALLSLVARLLVQHSTAYLGLMLRGWAVLAVEFALFVLCRCIAARSRALLYVLLLIAVFASAIVAAWGTGDYLLQALAGATNVRIFSTSTPDFLAGYLVLLLPVTLALFLGIPRTSTVRSPISGVMLRLLFGIILLMQMGVLFMTQSRFALFSLGIAVVVFLMATRAIRRGEAHTKSRPKAGQLGAAACLLLVCVLFAKPVIGRFSHLQDNSTAFRLWTWRGAAHMAAANPILGTGIGAWVDLYPQYALTGFTRLAHSGYLQMADECGIPALLVLLTTLGIVGVAGARRMTRLPLSVDMQTNETVSAIAPPDDRLLLAGLLAGLAASMAQNLADSDWFVFFLGVTFWAFAGLTAGTARYGALETLKFSEVRPLLWTAGGLAALGLALFGIQGTAAIFGHAALVDDTSTAAAQDDLTARTWDPLNARYPADLGWRVYARTDQLSDAEVELREAAALEPNGTNFRRLGTVFDREDYKTKAVAAYQAGLRVDPNSLDLRLALAQDSPPAQALELYRQMAMLEDSPVGRVRAIGEVTEIKFAIADAALGAAAADAGNATDAIRFDTRAQRLLESYADEGGTTNTEQQVLIGGRPAPDQDARMRDLYVQVMTRLAGLVPATQKPAVEDRAHKYQMRFLTHIAQGYSDLAASASTTPEVLEDFTAAANALQTYADGGGTPDPQENADMSRLYSHIMDSLARLLPPDQQAALAARRLVYQQKYDNLLSQGQ